MIRVLLFLASAKTDYRTSAIYPQQRSNARVSRLLLQIVAIQPILEPPDLAVYVCTRGAQLQ